MNIRLPDSPKLKLTQSTDKLTRRSFDRLEHVAILAPKDLMASAWKGVPYGAGIQKLLRRPDAGRSLLSTRFSNPVQTGATVGFVEPDASAFDLLSRSREIVAMALKDNPSTLGILVPAGSAAQTDRLLEALVAATWAAAVRLPSFKAKAKTGSRLKSVRLLGLGDKLDLSRTLAEAEGNGLARYLTALPANQLTPGHFRQYAVELAKVHGWKMRFLDEKRLAKIGAGAFLAVGQGNPRQDGGVVHLQYRPPRTKKLAQKVALVGKGICFDTGGTNLKPFKSMLHMHQDMEGAAVALGTLLALSRLEVDFAVDCWLALAENLIGSQAYKPQDLIVAKNGVSIQVVHTDAEGRMVLADTLTLAAEENPSLIVDYATLTGACVAALTTRYSGAFSNRPKSHEALIRAGRRSGERVWPFPLDEDFDTDLRSEVADVMQCSETNEGDHILAARFLGRFVPKSVPWVHLDLAAGHHKGGLAHIPTEITGFGVRYTLNLLLDERVHERWDSAA